MIRINKILTLVLVIAITLLIASISFAERAATNYEMLVPGNVSTGITTSLIYAGTVGASQRASAALITVESNSINFCLTGSAATAAAGTNLCHQMDAGQSYLIEGEANVANFRCIDRVAGSASKVKVTVFFGGE